jgi:hypothetical protein
LAACLALSGRGGAAPSDSTASARYLEYKAAVDKSSSLDDLVPFMTAEVAQRSARAPASIREGAWGSLKSVSGLLSRIVVVKETVAGDTARLQVKGISAPGGDKPTTGTVEMVREGGQWKMRAETWAIGAQPKASLDLGVTTTDWEIPAAEPDAPAASAPAEPGIDDAAARAATSEIRAIISAQAAYQSANFYYYDTLACLARAGGCIPNKAGGTIAFIKPELASLAARGGYARRFDPGPPPPTTDPDRGKASPSSMTVYAYWVIPDPAEPGRRARCGDANGILCEMPDAVAPPTKGECPIDHGCRVLN